VTNMTSAFSEKSSFNGDLKNWDTSSVTDMTSMFYNAFAFRGTFIYLERI
jgi:surface protein